MSLTVEEQPAARREIPPSMVERMTLILEAFEDGHVRLTLEEIARATKLPRSTVHRILDQLVRLEWLERHHFGYCLGRRPQDLSRGGTDHTELRSAAAPYLHDLLLRTGGVVHLAVLDQARVYYLDKMGGRFATSVPSRVGGSAPAHCTALGKAMLACEAPETVDELVGEQLSGRTTSTITALGALHRELNRIRARGGLALERGECFPDIACAAAAVRGPYGQVGALSIVGSVDVTLERVAPLVVDAARRIAADLFGDAAPDRRALLRTGRRPA